MGRIGRTYPNTWDASSSRSQHVSSRPTRPVLQSTDLTAFEPAGHRIAGAMIVLLLLLATIGWLLGATAA